MIIILSSLHYITLQRQLQELGLPNASLHAR